MVVNEIWSKPDTSLAGIAIMLIPIMARRTLMRPSLSDIQPDRMRPEALPNAPTTNPPTNHGTLDSCAPNATITNAPKTM